MNAISKKIVISRLIDKGINASDASNYCDSVLINIDDFSDYNSMYSFLVENYGKIIIN